MAVTLLAFGFATSIGKYYDCFAEKNGFASIKMRRLLKPWMDSYWVNQAFPSIP